jgi:hypothetical protein
MTASLYNAVTDQLIQTGWALLRLDHKKGCAKYLGPHGKMMRVPLDLHDPVRAKRLLRIAHVPHLSL